MEEQGTNRVPAECSLGERSLSLPGGHAARAHKIVAHKAPTARARHAHGRARPRGAQGLPTDDLSVQNGILVTRATRFPVLVDPQGQGRAWLRQREAANQLRTIGLADKAFRAALEARRPGPGRFGMCRWRMPALVHSAANNIKPLMLWAQRMFRWHQPELGRGPAWGHGWLRAN